MLVPAENLSRKQRQATPPRFAAYLVNRVREIFDVHQIAALWVAETTVYRRIMGVDCWPLSRNAFLFQGPGPVVCHPPCGAWGKHRHNCFHGLDGGIAAMEFVHRFGGVIEQPLGSRLFDVYGLGGRIEAVNQSDFGHRSLKPTLLYWIDNPPVKSLFAEIP